LAGSVVPEPDLVLHVHHHDCVGYQVEHTGLLEQPGFGLLSFGDIPGEALDANDMGLANEGAFDHLDGTSSAVVVADDGPIALASCRLPDGLAGTFQDDGIRRITGEQFTDRATEQRFRFVTQDLAYGRGKVLETVSGIVPKKEDFGAAFNEEAVAFLAFAQGLFGRQLRLGKSASFQGHADGRA